MLACRAIAYILLLHGWYAVPQQSIAANPSAPGECYTNKPTGEMVITAMTFAECEAKHGMWHRTTQGDIHLPDSAKYGPGAFTSDEQSQQFDVPAVQQPSKESPNGPECLMSPCGHALTKWCHGGGWIGDMHIEEECSDHPPMVDGCDFDTRRVLLTSEDGKHHCVLLEAWPKPTSDKCWRYAYMQPVDAQGAPDGEQLAVRICQL